MFFMVKYGDVTWNNRMIGEFHNFLLVGRIIFQSLQLLNISKRKAEASSSSNSTSKRRWEGMTALALQPLLPYFNVRV
jgi:large-conductance mechanosensitive channel